MREPHMRRNPEKARLGGGGGAAGGWGLEGGSSLQPGDTRVGGRRVHEGVLGSRCRARNATNQTHVRTPAHRLP